MPLAGSRRKLANAKERRNPGPFCARRICDRNARIDTVAPAGPRKVSVQRFRACANAEPGCFRNSGMYEPSSFTCLVCGSAAAPVSRCCECKRSRQASERYVRHSTTPGGTAESVNRCNGRSTAADAITGFCLHLLVISVSYGWRADGVAPARWFCSSARELRLLLRRQARSKSVADLG